MSSSCHLEVASHGREKVGGGGRVQAVKEKGDDNSGGGPVALVQKKSVSASERGPTGGGYGNGGGSGSGSGTGRSYHIGHDGNGTKRGGGGAGSTRSPMKDDQFSSYLEAGDLLDDDIYEDLDDEDNDELDNQISILENRFSAVGRERPTSAVKLSGGQHASSILGGVVDPERRTAPQQAQAVVARSARRPPRSSRSPQLPSAAMTTRRLASAGADGAATARRTNNTHDLDHHYFSSACVGARALLVRRTRSRPTSAPANSSLFYERGVSDPGVALDGRRMRLEMSRASADAGRYRSAAARERKGGVGDVNQRAPARDVRKSGKDGRLIGLCIYVCVREVEKKSSQMKELDEKALASVGVCLGAHSKTKS